MSTEMRIVDCADGTIWFVTIEKCFWESFDWLTKEKQYPKDEIIDRGWWIAGGYPFESPLERFEHGLACSIHNAAIIARDVQNGVSNPDWCRWDEDEDMPPTRDKLLKRAPLI